jgi:hypothetical protein
VLAGDTPLVVQGVEIRTHTVEVFMGGSPRTYRYDANVVIYDGSPPQEIVSKPQWRLTNEGVAALAWHRLRPMRGEDAQKSLADSPQQPQIKPASQQEPSLDERALALFFADRSRTKKEIASLLGVQTQSICPSRCPRLDQAMQAWRAANSRQRPHGSKDKDGNVEAWDEDE